MQKELELYFLLFCCDCCSKQDLSQGQDSSPDSAWPIIKNFNVKLFASADADANADANADVGGSTIALPGLRPGELMNAMDT